MVDIEINLEEIGVKRQIGDSTIGFLKFTLHGKNEDAISLGSGVLVRIGKVSGVLTASHVLKAMPTKGEIGIVTFPTRSEKLQMYRLNVKFLAPLTIGSKPWGSRGPDIAFLKLPLPDVSTLDATNTFLNLEKRLSKITKAPQPTKNSIYEVGGVLDELTTDKKPASTKYLTKKFEGRVHDVTIAPMTNTRKWDRIQATPNTIGDNPFPTSFGGMSGGGLWKIFVSLDEKGKPKIVENRLCGIMYFQTRRSKRRLVCHGQKSIYEEMVARIKRKWPEARE